MRQIFFICITMALTGILSSEQAIAGKPESLDENLNSLLNNIQQNVRQMNTVEHAAATKADYEHLFGWVDSVELSSLSDEELALVFRAADSALFFTNAPNSLHHMESALHELNTRGASTDSQWFELYKAYVGGRKFAEANLLREGELKKEVPVLPALSFDQEIRKNTYVLEISEDSSGVDVRYIDTGNGKQIVVAAHPQCHFTQDAFESISQHAALRTAMSDAILIAPADQNPNFGIYSDWQDRHPGFPIYPVVNQGSWPIPSWNTPTFYFLEEGEIVDTVVGWPPGDANIDALLEAVRKHGYVE